MTRRNKTHQVLKNQPNLTLPGKDLQNLVDQLLRLSTQPPPSNISKSIETQREINDITEKIKEFERNKCLTNPPRDGAAIDRFLKWARENGALLNGCSIQEFPGFEFGIKADIDICESSLVIAVPRKLMMSVESARESDLKEFIEKDRILSSMPNVTLSIFLLFEKFKREDSFWWPYIQMLPPAYSTVLYFSLEELEELKGSPTLEIGLKQIKSIARQYAYFHKLFTTSNHPACKFMRKHFTFQEYCWAVSTIMTRQNTIPAEENLYALIPLWDMCNHTNGNISTAYNPVLDRSDSLALRNFKAGEQLFIFYGNRTNSELFIHNGFVYEDNENDLYWIKLGISKSDPLAEKRNRLLEQIQISNGSFCIRKNPVPIDAELLAFLRIFNMNEGSSV